MRQLLRLLRALCRCGVDVTRRNERTATRQLHDGGVRRRDTAADADQDKLAVKHLLVKTDLPASITILTNVLRSAIILQMVMFVYVGGVHVTPLL